jgi:hypothetical protein
VGHFIERAHVAMPHALTCECNGCPTCSRRANQRRSRARYRALATGVMDASPVAIGEGLFRVGSSWEKIEEWCWRNFGPPTASVSADMGSQRMSDNPSYLQRRYRAMRGARNLKRSPLTWGPLDFHNRQGVTSDTRSVYPS